MDSMRRAIERARERVAVSAPAAALAELAPALKAAAERGVAVDAHEEPASDRLAVVVGDGVETVLADLGRDRPEGMWTHHPAVALLAADHLRARG
jgi:hypothetical protein